jgi:5-methylcytosine-specific restriction endonuclease McrA
VRSPYNAIHRAIRAEVLARANYRCHWCGGVANSADHVVEVANGGRNVLDNYVAACGYCNSSRGGRLGNQRRQAGRFTTSRKW